MSQLRLSAMSVQEKHTNDCLEDEEEEEMDPRIQTELNRLNEASNEINKYENQLDEARTKHRSTLSESSQELKSLSRNMRKTISRARAYYELKAESKRAQEETIRAAGLYQMANSIYRAAKETIMLAEEKLTHEGQTAELSTAWQEMLNHATIRVAEAEKEKRNRQEEHHRTAKTFAELELQLQMNEKLYPKSIEKARAYFEKKTEMEQELEQQKQNVISLQKRLQEAKTEYSSALKNLEQISEELHEKRKLKALLQYPREPGVGAESETSKCLSISEMNLGSLTLSTGSDEEYSSESSSSEDDFSKDQDSDQNSQDEIHSDRVDNMDMPPFPRPETPLPPQPPTPPTTPIFPSDSPISPQFPGFVSPPSYTVYSSSPSSSFSSSSIITCPATSTSSWLSSEFCSISLSPNLISSPTSVPTSPEEKPFALSASPSLESRSVEGAVNEDAVSVAEPAKITDKKHERERAPIKIFTAFRERFLSKPFVRSGAKLERGDTSEEDISI